MGIIGSALGGAMKIGGGIFGGIKASKAIRDAKRNIRNQLNENQNWYDRRYNEDATQRADAQRILTMTQDNIRKRNQAAAGAQAVMGGGDEAVAAAREANNQALADATSQIAVAGEARKDNIESQYLNRKNALNQQLNELNGKKAGAIAQAVGGVADAAGSLATSIPDPARVKTQAIKPGKEMTNLPSQSDAGKLLGDANKRDVDYLNKLGVKI